MDTSATASYLRALINNGVTFLAEVRTTDESHYAKLVVYGVDDLGIRAAAAGYDFLIIPWTVIGSVLIDITN